MNSVAASKKTFLHERKQQCARLLATISVQYRKWKQEACAAKKERFCVGIFKD